MDRSVARKGALQSDSSTNVLSPSTSTRSASNPFLETETPDRLATLEPAVPVEAQSRINDTTADAADSMPAAVGDGLSPNPFSPNIVAEASPRAALQTTVSQTTVPQEIVAQDPAYANPLNAESVKNSNRQEPN